MSVDPVAAPAGYSRQVRRLRHVRACLNNFVIAAKVRETAQGISLDDSAVRDVQVLIGLGVRLAEVQEAHKQARTLGVFPVNLKYIAKIVGHMAMQEKETPPPEPEPSEILVPGSRASIVEKLRATYASLAKKETE